MLYTFPCTPQGNIIIVGICWDKLVTMLGYSWDTMLGNTGVNMGGGGVESCDDGEGAVGEDLHSHAAL